MLHALAAITASQRPREENALRQDSPPQYAEAQDNAQQLICRCQLSTEENLVMISGGANELNNILHQVDISTNQRVLEMENRLNDFAHFTHSSLTDTESRLQLQLQNALKESNAVITATNDNAFALSTRVASNEEATSRLNQQLQTALEQVEIQSQGIQDAAFAAHQQACDLRISAAFDQSRSWISDRAAESAEAVIKRIQPQLLLRIDDTHAETRQDLLTLERIMLQKLNGAVESVKVVSQTEVSEMTRLLAQKMDLSFIDSVNSSKGQVRKESMLQVERLEAKMQRKLDGAVAKGECQASEQEKVNDRTVTKMAVVERRVDDMNGEVLLMEERLNRLLQASNAQSRAYTDQISSEMFRAQTRMDKSQRNFQTETRAAFSALEMKIKVL